MLASWYVRKIQRGRQGGGEWGEGWEDRLVVGLVVAWEVEMEEWVWVDKEECLKAFHLEFT